MFNARVILDSIGPNGARLTTFELTLPRIVLAEFNTHRMFARNSASSRAIPVEKMLRRVLEDPFVPEYWGKNQKGMQAEQELLKEEQECAEEEWLYARDRAVDSARSLLNIGVHKQLTNRLIEPWLWHTIIFTATELDNFYALRANKMAQPEFRTPAEMLLDVYHASKPMELEAGEWHLPLVTNYEVFLSDATHRTWKRPNVEEDGRMRDQVMDQDEWKYWAKVSVSRCARISYLTHEGKRDLSEDIAKHDELLTNGHMSPFEHPAMALTRTQWQALARSMANEWIERRIPTGNFWGWHQYRKTLRNEHDFSKIGAAT